MERGVYFDAWFPRQHCYHPSLPPRRLRMVDDLVDYGATMLVWSALGGGSVALPYLELEAFGEIDPRFRFYGFVNDSEFIAACRRRGIKVFGIVFEVQGWEFPAELSEDEDRILALNELRGAGKQVTLGLREFGQNRFPRLWKPLEHYFPGGLVNSKGEPVDDLIEECVSRDIHGEACHARWVEVPDSGQECFLMDRNNPVWREYLKAVIRIQIDAGVDGIQLDEAETPMTAMQYGGCFCRDCMDGFREYLRARPPAEVEDLDSFHYGEWLLRRGFDFKSRREETPLFWEYHRYQQRQIKHHFGELAAYARSYAASVGREVLVSGNFFNLFDHYLPLEPDVDVLITEMRNTTYRQPDWYRYVAGFGGAKPVVVVENPYGGVVPELIEALGKGRGRDRFRQSLYEAAALGVNMTVPYGSWMGSVIEDAFYAPHELCVEIQTFLARHEELFSRETWSEVAVVYSVRSMQALVAARDTMADNRANVSRDVTVPFWDACRALSDARQPYDVVFFPDGELREDSLRPEDLARYRTLVLPGERHLTERQAELLRSYRGQVLEAPVLGDPQVEVDAGAADFAVCVHRVEAGAAVHLIRYDHDDEADGMPPLPELQLTVRLPQAFTCATPFSPDGHLNATLDGAAAATAPEGRGPTARPGVRHRLRLTDLGVYGIVLLT